MNKFAWTILLLAAPIFAATAPDDFDVRLEIKIPSNASLLKVDLPEDVYRAMRRPDLGDIRIFNAAGEAVPMARLPRTKESREQRVELPLLPLPKVDASNGDKLVVARDASGSNLRVEIESQKGQRQIKVVPGYLLEVKGFDKPIDELVLGWPEATAFEAKVTVRVSDDLSSWRTAVNGAPVLAIGEGAAGIRQDRIKMRAVKARYLRISWVGVKPNVTLSRATLIHNETPMAVEHQWLTLDGKTNGDLIEFVSPGLFPADKIRLVPATESDVLPATLYSRRKVSERWRWRARTLGYRLRQNGNVEEGRPDNIQKTRDPLWLVELDKGARSTLQPRLQLGWRPDQVAFVARGKGPFTLAVGNSSAKPLWLTPGRVVPGFGKKTAAIVSRATVVTNTNPVKPVSRSAAPWDLKSNWILWAVLALGVVVLGVMARGLWRDMNSDATDDASDKE